jgi:hypothetical protein
MHRRPSVWVCTVLDPATAESDLLGPRHCLPTSHSLDLATGIEWEDAPYRIWGGERPTHGHCQLAPLPMSDSLVCIRAPSSRSIICGAASWFSIWWWLLLRCKNHCNLRVPCVVRALGWQRARRCLASSFHQVCFIALHILSFSRFFENVVPRRCVIGAFSSI